MVNTISKSIEDIFKEIDSRKEELIERTIFLTEIAAPPFMEENRALAMEKIFSQLGYKTKIDEIGNVIASSESTTNEVIVIAAHLDTVFGSDVKIKVKREGDILHGPGVGDDTRGLINLIELARYAKVLNIDNNFLFVANVGEEGSGDLRGTKHLFYSEEHQNLTITRFITIDGTGNDRIVNQSIGSKRYSVVFRGEGGHSYGAFGLANPAFALGKFLSAMNEIKVPKSPRTTYSAGILRGGTSVNSIPFEVSVDIDLRSESQKELMKLVNTVKKLAQQAIKDVLKRSNGKLQFNFIEIGDRPAGKNIENSILELKIAEANRYFGIDTIPTPSSTDANIPHNLGVDALSIAGVQESGNAHSLDEWINAGESSLITIKRNILFMYLLAE